MDGGFWYVDQWLFVGYMCFVEDLQWLLIENMVFVFCLVDVFICIWDIWVVFSKVCMFIMVIVYDGDVNVISWSCWEFFLFSGGDDGVFKIWDFWQFKFGFLVVIFKQYVVFVIFVEWYFQDSGVFVVLGVDYQIIQWDLVVEWDFEVGDVEVDFGLVDFLQQLLFVYQGEIELKELYWYLQCLGFLVSMVLLGFIVFCIISV